MSRATKRSKQAPDFASELVQQMTMFTRLRKYFSPFVLENEELGLLQIFKPLYFVLSVVGLLPSSIEFPSGKRDLIVLFKSTAVSLASTLLMTVIVSVSFGLHMLELSVSAKDNSYTEDQITTTNYVANLVLTFLSCGIAYICALKNRNLYIDILNGMVRSWTDIPNSTSEGILGPLRVQVNCMVLGSLLLLLIVQLAITLTEDLPKYKVALIALTFNLPEMLQFTVLAFYFVLIVMLVAVLKNIEENFAMFASMSVGSHCARLKLASSLRQLRGVYARALAVKRQVNAAFQAPLLLIVARAFHTIISDAHAIYHGATFQDDMSIHNVIEVCFWVGYQLVIFHILGFSSSLLKMQVNKIGRALYNISAHVNTEIIQYKSWTDTKDELITLHLEIQHFASLMKFQDTEITIYGLFPLNPSLLFNVVASAATYVLILVEFDYGQ